MTSIHHIHKFKQAASVASTWHGFGFGDDKIPFLFRRSFAFHTMYTV